MDRSNRDHHRDHHREHREHREPPTLAFHMKTWKIIHKQLRAISKFTRENTTITFTSQPSIVIQSARNHMVSKITIGSECLYVTDTDHFTVKTINNNIPLFDSFMHIISNSDISKMYIQNDSDLYTRLLVTASDTCAQASIPCVHGQELIKENGKCPVRVDCEHSTIVEILKWISPTTKSKRTIKPDMSIVQIIVQSNPPIIKFTTEMNELEYPHNNKVAFYDAKNVRLFVSAKNFYNALAICAIIKSHCSIRTMVGKDMKLCIISKNNYLTIENYITQEQSKDDLKFERSCKIDDGKNERISKNEDSNKQDTQHKITNYMVSNKTSSNSQTYFNDSKDESDTDESVNFEYNHSCSKRQRCSV